MVNRKQTRDLIQISDDSILSQTRAAILARIGLQVTTFDSGSGTFEHSVPIPSIALICQSLNSARACELAGLLRSYTPDAVLVRFAFPDECYSSIYDSFIYCPIRPATFQSVVTDALELAELRPKFRTKCNLLPL